MFDTFRFHFETTEFLEPYICEKPKITTVPGVNRLQAAPPSQKDFLQENVALRRELFASHHHEGVKPGAAEGIGERQETEDGVVRQDGSEGQDEATPQATDSATNTATFQPTQETTQAATTEAAQPTTTEAAQPTTTEAAQPTTTEATDLATNEATALETNKATHPAAHEATQTRSTSSDPSLPAPERSPASVLTEPGDLPQQTDHQVVTRRMQFKAKRSRTESKKKAKVAKAAAKQQKQEDRQKKRLAKETKKEQAAELKRQKKAQRDLEKEDRKTKKRSKKASEEQQDAEPKQDHADDSTSKTLAKKKKKTHQQDQASEASCPGCSVHPAGSGDEDGQDKTFAKGTPFNSTNSKKTSKRKKLAMMQKKLKRTKGGNRKMGKKHLGKRGAKQTSTHSGGPPAKPMPSKRPPTGSTRPKPKKPSKTTTPTKTEYVNLVTDVLRTCKSSNCTHPDWETPSFDKQRIQISTYWSRCAVGVKIKRQGKKSQKGGGKLEQVAYFSCPSWCIYSNMAIAHVYVGYLVFFRAVGQTNTGFLL